MTVSLSSGARRSGRAVAFLATLALGSSGCRDKSAAPTSDAGAPVHEADARPRYVEAPIDDSALPAASSEDLDRRMRHLLEAIAHDEPALAADVLFPRDGYGMVRDAADPQKIWDTRVEAGFRRAIAHLHKRLTGIERAKFVSFEIGRTIVQLTPKKNEFKKPLWRVKHSKLTFTIDGKERHLDIAEMTAWRGAWYVTRLR